MKFGYTILYVRDVARTVAFYEAAFGLQRGFASNEGDYAEMLTGDTKLAFAQVELAASNGVPFDVVSPEAPPPGIELGLVTDDVTRAYEKAVAAGAAGIAAPQLKPWGQSVSYVRDLNGFLIEICSPVGS